MGIGKKYISQGVSQPFEVAITNLQVRYVPKRNPKRKQNGIFSGGGGARGAEGDDVRLIKASSLILVSGGGYSYGIELLRQQGLNSKERC